MHPRGAGAQHKICLSNSGNADKPLFTYQPCCVQLVVLPYHKRQGFILLVAEYTCPLVAEHDTLIAEQAVMAQCVIAADGYRYERRATHSWLRHNSCSTRLHYQRVLSNLSTSSLRLLLT